MREIVHIQAGQCGNQVRVQRSLLLSRPTSDQGAIILALYLIHARMHAAFMCCC